jgi:hypothetical protein
VTILCVGPQSSLTAFDRRGIIDLEAKFEPNLLNTAIYLLSLSQQVSTFAINFQVRAKILLIGKYLTITGSAFP